MSSFSIVFSSLLPTHHLNFVIWIKQNRIEVMHEEVLTLIRQIKTSRDLSFAIRFPTQLS